MVPLKYMISGAILGNTVPSSAVVAKGASEKANSPNILSPNDKPYHY